MSAIKKEVTGMLDFDIEQTTYGENVYILDIVNDKNGRLYEQIEEFIDKNVKITIEEIKVEE